MALFVFLEVLAFFCGLFFLSSQLGREKFRILFDFSLSRETAVYPVHVQSRFLGKIIVCVCVCVQSCSRCSHNNTLKYNGPVFQSERGNVCQCLVVGSVEDTCADNRIACCCELRGEWGVAAFRVSTVSPLYAVCRTARVVLLQVGIGNALAVDSKRGCVRY